MRTLGVERERFIVRDGSIVPLIDGLLPELHQFCREHSLLTVRFGYELFAGQIEDRTAGEKSVDEVMSILDENEQILLEIGDRLGLQFRCVDYVTKKELGELVVNSFSQRHRQIWSDISHRQKVAASQVAAIHVHVSVSSKEAIEVLTHCRKDVIDNLVAIGDFSDGKRIAAYRTMAGGYGDPPVFLSVASLMAYIKEKGGERNVWDLVRYKPLTGTIEFRTFGATESNENVRQFVETALYLVESVLTSHRAAL